MSVTGILDLNELLKLIVASVLQLGCDIDHLVKQIFNPLIFQLIHWYTSPTQNGSPHSAIMIDILMVYIYFFCFRCIIYFAETVIIENVKQKYELIKKINITVYHRFSLSKIGHLIGVF